MGVSDEQDRRLSEAQVLMLASLIDKIANVENNISVNRHINNNESISWQNYTLGLLGILWIVLSGLFFDVRNKVEKVHDEHTARKSTIENVRKMQETQEQKTLEILEIKTKITALDRSIDRIILRMINLDRKLITLIPDKKSGVGSEWEY